MKVSLIITVFNEEKTVRKLLDSILVQSKLPQEVVIVDGGSTDQTLEKLTAYIPSFAKRRVKLKILIRSGNRSVGRNQAVRHANGEIILCTDAGCILDDKWVANILMPFDKSNVDVVAGYYRGMAETPFQRSLIPYVLVMQDKVDPKHFLPASRSMAFRKKIWSKVKGFPIQYSHNEDYVFAKELQRVGAKIVFQENAVVYWIPRKTAKEAFIMFFRFAFGDAESGQFRPKVLLVFLRYFLGIVICIAAIVFKEPVLLVVVAGGFIAYCIWAVTKNYFYVKDRYAFVYLPILQIIADVAVLIGTTFGIMKRVWATQEMQ